MPHTRASSGIVRPSSRAAEAAEAAEAAAKPVVSRKPGTKGKSPAVAIVEAQEESPLSDLTELDTLTDPDAVTEDLMELDEPAEEHEPDDVEQEHLSEGSHVLKLISRIHSAILYTQTTAMPLSYSHFTLPTSPTAPEYPALQLLRDAHASDIATFICASEYYETYALAVKPIHRARLLHEGGSNDAQWWVGLSAAQMRAGPGASEHQIKKAGSALKEKEKRKKENEKKKGKGRLKQELLKLEKGLKLQEEREARGIDSDDEWERAERQEVPDTEMESDNEEYE